MSGRDDCVYKDMTDHAENVQYLSVHFFIIIILSVNFPYVAYRIIYDCQYSILEFFEATVVSDNRLIRHSVKGNQATAVERVECLSLVQLSALAHHRVRRRQ